MRIDIELFRIISAFGIVYFHSGNLYGREVAYGGLIFFVIVSSYFATKSLRQKKPLDRFKRLIVPCILWSIIYGFLNFVLKGKIFLTDCYLAGCILSTPSIHLWYLPYIYLVLIAIDWIKTAFSKDSIGSFSGVIAAILLLSASIWRTFEYPVPFGQYLHALPGVFIGIYLGYYFSIKVRHRKFILLLIIASILLTVCLTIKGVGIPYLLGLLPSLLLLKQDLFTKSERPRLGNTRLTLTKNTIKIIPSIASLMFGVYLVHSIFIVILRYLGMNDYSLPLVAFILSLAFVFIVREKLPQKIHRYLV